MPFTEPADIFFIITSIAIVAVSIIAVWAGVLLIRTLKNIQYISKSARKESDKVVKEVDTLLQFLHSLGMLFSRGKKKKKK